MFPSEPPVIWKAASSGGESGFGAHLGEPGEETNRKVGKGDCRPPFVIPVSD